VDEGDEGSSTSTIQNHDEIGGFPALSMARLRLMLLPGERLLGHLQNRQGLNLQGTWLCRAWHFHCAITVWRFPSSEIAGMYRQGPLGGRMTKGKALNWSENGFASCRESLTPQSELLEPVKQSDKTTNSMSKFLPFRLVGGLRISDGTACFYLR